MITSTRSCGCVLKQTFNVTNNLTQVRLSLALGEVRAQCGTAIFCRALPEAKELKSSSQY